MCFLLTWRREVGYLVFAVFGYRRAVTDYNVPVLLSCSFPGPLIKDFAEVLFCFVAARAYISVLRVLATSSGGLRNRGNTRAWAPRIYAVCLTLSNFQSPLQNLNVQRQSIRGILVSPPEEWSGSTRKGEQMRRILFIQTIKGKELRKLSAARKRLPASITALCYSSVLSVGLGCPPRPTLRRTSPWRACS